MADRDPIDWAHTQRAEHDRTLKAKALAVAARELGVPAAGLVVGGGGRRAVRRHAGLASASEETWHAASQLLAADAPPERPRPRACARCGHGERPVRLYLCGWRCDPCSPAALAGCSVPAPRADLTADALRARRAAALVPDLDPDLATAKASTRSAIERGRIAETAHQRLIARRAREGGGPRV
ncbi:hypothetical protein [Cellulomonas oligotrophica]|uniref:Uncharacterized protein n=1 Tax=Cellulomonas oligotrophica TaxID=931536 RepID=A0A7Y9FI74_9CELL|nr:hypothetical protein [Cellulomonas oligotrophica]NYD87790.1 hypothetical protein [Cellulomonas oligotrophica]GIG33005.1 hypothetical protein Col01nite_21640 [Cellulomonas oligotrophica]